MSRIEIASHIMAGFAANPSVFAQNGSCGWSLVNCTDEDIAGYALHLADKLIEGDKILSERAAIDAARSSAEHSSARKESK